MKKIISVGLIFFVLFSFCSCGFTVTEVNNELAEITTQTQSQTAKTTESTTQNNKTSTVKSIRTVSTKKSAESTTEKSTERLTTRKSENKQNKKTVTCTMEISCEKIFDNKDKLKENKIEFLPSNGVILYPITVSVPDGSTAFDVIKKVCAENVCADKCKFCQKNGIHIDYIYTPGYDSYYIRGIHQIYEKDCGTQSGWMYSVNGEFLNYGCNQYKVKSGDKIKIMYTCNTGEDLGEKY